MATLRDIRNRIKAVKNTQKITRAMKMVAAARLRKAQENILNARPYADNIESLLSRALKETKVDISPLLIKKEKVSNVLIVIFSSDKGLCGSFNLNITKKAISFSEELQKKGVAHIEFCPIGKKSKDYLKFRHFDVLEYNNGMFVKINPVQSEAFAKFLIDTYIKGEFDEIYLAYNKFKTVMTQVATIEKFLPLEFEEEKDQKKADINYIFEPDIDSIVVKIIEKYTKNKIWKALLESFASEMGARMTAMDMATENAKELLRLLQIKFNKERQAAITKEILEVVSGANALKEK
jgi:F-type H+-transporting ATPase subunit gamma